MFQFPGFAFIPYLFRNKYLLLISASPKIAEPELDRPPASAPPECASRRASSGRLLGITEIEGGFPHSEILGSKPVRGSPRLIAAYHVLHRLSAPRHPPDTLKTLDCSHRQSARRCVSIDFGNRSTPHVLARKDQFCFKRIRGSERSGSKPTTGCSRDKMMTRRLSVRSSRTFRLHASPYPAFSPSSRQALARSTKLINCTGKDRNASICSTRRQDLAAQTLVEPDGIEPTTSCLQSTRSPN